MYRILATDLKEHHAGSVEEVRQLMANGIITSQAKARRQDGKDWKPLTDFPEFKELIEEAGQGAPTKPNPPPIPPPLAETPSEPPAAPSKGLAKTSLCLGVLSMLGCLFLTGIPAVITGHIAHRRSLKTPPTAGGGGMAVAGLVLGYLSIVLTPILGIVVAVAIPAVTKAKAQSLESQCVNQMNEICQAARRWSNNHNDRFPPDYAALSSELSQPSLLVCPADLNTPHAATWSRFKPENTSYVYLAPGTEAHANEQTAVFQCRIHNNIGFVDGTVVREGRHRRRRF